MKMHYAYRFCNLGGVSSVIRERIEADKKNELEISCNFEIDGGGFAQLSEKGAKVEINKNYHEATIQYINQNNVDSLHLIDEAAILPTMRELYGGRLVLEVHSSTPRYLDEISSSTAASADAILAPSQWSRQQILMRINDSELHKKVHILPNIALDPLPRSSKTTGRLVDDQIPNFLWVGKASEGKNWRDLLRIFAAVSANLDCRLVMVTGGMIEKDKKAEVISEILALGIENIVDWRHNLRREAISNLYSACAESGGTLIVTSLAESFGLTVIEALSHGLPVVSSNSGALPELLDDGVNGAVFQVGSVSKPIKILSNVIEGKLTFNREKVVGSVPEACKPKNHLVRLRAILDGIEPNLAANQFFELLEAKQHTQPKTLPWPKN